MRTIRLCLPVALMLAFGCRNQSPGDGSPVLARVGDGVVTARDLEARVALLAHSQHLLDHFAKPEKKKELLDGLIQAEALYQEARRLGYDRDPAVKQNMVNRMLQAVVDFAGRGQDGHSVTADLRASATAARRPDGRDPQQDQGRG